MKKLMIAAVTGLVLSSCGGEKKTESTEQSTPTQQEATQPENAVEEPVAAPTSQETLSLESNDQMRFDKAELRVKAGSEVTLTLTHVGAMGKEVMGHNFVLLKEGTSIETFAAQAARAKDTDYIPSGDVVLAHTKLIGGGESDTITFIAPAKGTYEFICSFPGHYGLMKGEFIVE
ncbi:azurin [Algoriphagus sp. 4150]|uniref:azurin n=1 Tax=Algoriphagus sp. 4150 TaxID=2817756 RepID=UPI0028547A1F|nr:azurin [Algoriphagus sp. 4150]MDR7130396.1 azurin [Algoriphagus sp. 4150]